MLKMFPISEKREKSVSSLQFSQWFRLRKVFFFTQFHVNMWSLFCVWWCIWILQPRGRLHMSIYSNQINANSKREEKKMWRMKLCWHCAMELITNSIWFCKSFFCVISICIKVIIIHINWFHFHADSIHSYIVAGHGSAGLWITNLGGISNGSFKFILQTLKLAWYFSICIICWLANFIQLCKSIITNLLLDHFMGW